MVGSIHLYEQYGVWWLVLSIYIRAVWGLVVGSIHLHESSMGLVVGFVHILESSVGLVVGFVHIH